MKIGVQWSVLKQTRWYEYAVRFVFGGTVTALAGVIAHQYGPAVGGLFLAFPAICPATLTLVESHERRKAKPGESRQRRATQAAALDAAGAALGSLGLLAFGALVWALAAHMPAAGMLALAALAWVAVSVTAWVIRQKV